MKAEDLMTKDVCWVDPEATLSEASALMGQRHIGSALVMDGPNLVGIVTERDVVRAMSNAHDAPIRPVAEWMSRKPVTAGPGTPIKEALRTMVEGGFRHLPIVDGDKPVGMISMRDIAKTLSD